MDNITTKSFLLRFPKTLFNLLKSRSRQEGVSINKLSIRLIESGLKFNTSEPFTLIDGSQPAALINLVREVIYPAFEAQLEAVVLYGSYARGESRESSDIDLLIVLNREGEIDRDTYSRLPPVSLDKKPVSYLIVKFPEAPRGIWLNVALDGVVLFDRFGEAIRFLARARKVILSGEVKRELVHGIPYWMEENSNDGRPEV